MELTMSAQNDASPWEVPVKVPVETLTPETILHGRGYFSELGVVRRKPCMTMDLNPSIKLLIVVQLDQMRRQQCRNLAQTRSL